MKIYKKLIFILLLLAVSKNALADATSVPSGLFQFSSNLELITAKKYDRFSTLTSVGKSHLEELKAKNWTCQQRPASSVECTQFLKNQTLPQEFSTSLLNKYAQFSIKFAASFQLSPTNETDYIREYDVHQVVDVFGQKITNYVLRESKSSASKLQMEVLDKKLFFYVLDERTIGIQETMIFSDKNVSTLYLVQVTLNKQ